MDYFFFHVNKIFDCSISNITFKLSVPLCGGNEKCESLLSADVTSILGQKIPIKITPSNPRSLARSEEQQVTYEYITMYIDVHFSSFKIRQTWSPIHNLKCTLCAITPFQIRAIADLLNGIMTNPVKAGS